MLNMCDNYVAMLYSRVPDYVLIGIARDIERFLYSSGVDKYLLIVLSIPVIVKTLFFLKQFPDTVWP